MRSSLGVRRLSANSLYFEPHPLARNPHFQTIISTRMPPPKSEMASVAQEKMLNLPVDDGVRLQGFYSPQRNGKSKGMVLLLHGWLGSVESTYMISEGEALFQRGYSVFRLNMRDHGGTVALNEETFHGCRLEEVFQAAHQIAKLEPDAPFFIVGFSMGGNFSLRLAWRHSQQTPITNLQRVVAVNPSINTRRTILDIDRSPLYRPYFLRKWHRHLIEKEAAFPHLYDFSALQKINNSYDLGEATITAYTGYPDSNSYYQCYAVTPEKMRPLTVPTTTITSKDDPIIAVEDFKDLAGVNPHLSVLIQQYGGHMGYIDLFPFRRWLNQAIASILA